MKMKMKTLMTICAVAGLILATNAIAAIPVSSTMHFSGALAAPGGGVYTGTIAATAGTYYMPGGAGTVVDGSKPSGYATPDGSDATGGFDVYAKQGATSYYDGGGNPPGSLVTRLNVDGGVIAADHDGYGSPGGGWGAFWSPNVPDWNNFQLTLTAGTWALERVQVSRGTPMSGAMNWGTMFASEDDTGSYTGTVPADADCNSGFAATVGGGAQAWDMDWSWGSEAIPLEYAGFDVSITSLGGGNYDVSLTPAPEPAMLGLLLIGGLALLRRRRK